MQYLGCAHELGLGVDSEGQVGAALLIGERDPEHLPVVLVLDFGVCGIAVVALRGRDREMELCNATGGAHAR